jgi:hypothetical protein
MPRLATPLAGDRLKVHGRPLDFSFWATAKQKRGHAAPQPQVFANDPWNVIASALNRHCNSSRLSAASIFLDQAKDYYDVANASQLTAARPLLSYYSMLNMTKSYILTFGPHNNLDSMRHGLQEANARNPSFLTHSLEVHPSTAQTLNGFAEFQNSLTGRPVNARSQLSVSQLFAQSILGHRLWSSAASRRERFVQVARVWYMHSQPRNQVWLRLYFFADDLSRLGITHRQLLTEGRFSTQFHQVTCSELEGNRSLICFEQQTPIASSNWPSDRIASLNALLKDNLWEVLLSSAPYRRYYAYVAPASETVLHQLVSIYALAYYFGSVTRYRPRQFQDMLNSPFGSFIREFVDHQILQFAYVLAAEFDKRDVVKPAVI